MEKRKLLIAIDGNSLMHRAYYALPPMTSQDGTPTGAVFGFLSMLLKVLERKPEYLVVAFDMHGPTFRHAHYEEYKAGRRETPDDLRPQFHLLQEILQQMGILVATCESYEADDILGTFARRAESAGVEALLVTGDRDALQLISPFTHVLLTKKGISDTVEMDEAELLETYGLTPERMRDLKGLMGDTSDNIPGIPGVGEKTALKLLQEYGSMEAVLSHAGEVKGKLGEKIQANGDLARMSYELGCIFTDVPLTVTIEESRFVEENLAGALHILRQYQLNAIVKRLPEGQAAVEISKESTAHVERVRVEALNALAGLVEGAQKAGRLAMAIEKGALFLAADEDMEYCVSFGGTLLEQGLEPAEVFDLLRPILEEEAIATILFDVKAWMHRLSDYGISLRGEAYDAMIEDYLLNATRPAAGLAELVQEKLAMEPGAAALLRIRRHMLREIESNGLMELYDQVERPLTGVLYRMEKEGFLVDAGVLHVLDGQFMARAGELEEEIYAHAGERFNILSTKQLGNILFSDDKLHLPTQRKTKTGYSTDAEALEALLELHPIIAPIQEYRFLTKLKSTFVDGLLASISEKDGRVHTSFNQNVTATGRISSTEPNLQNIPVRTELGREIRKAFVASPGNVLLGADYSQIELRLLAHISGDEAMIQSFLEGGDIHTKTASEVFGVAPEAVTQAQRSAAKAVNFGIVYGISGFGLSRNLGIGRKQAEEYIALYLNRYPKVKAYMQRSVEQGKAEGYVATLLNRRRELHELKSSQYNTRAFGERVAMNMPIQGSAADIIKLAMVHVDEALREKRLKAKLILQVHDELLLDVPEDEKETCMGLVKECMENAMALKVPLVAEVRAGHSWYDTK